MDAFTGFPPKAFLIGAQKCGTTAFAAALARHPGITLAAPKEPAFFTRNYGKGTEWYRSCFERHDTVLLDASPGYTMAPAHRDDEDSSPFSGVPERIHRLSPDARFIYIVRDPVRRAYSSYWHAVRSGDESRSLRRAMTLRSMYLRGSLYFSQVSRYIDLFGHEALLILDMREWKRDAQASLAQAFRHFGLAPPRERVDIPRVNESYMFNRLGSAIQSRGILRRPAAAAGEAIRRAVPLSWYRRLRGLMVRDIPPMNEEEYRHIRAMLEEDARAFAELTGIDVFDGPPPPSQDA